MVRYPDSCISTTFSSKVVHIKLPSQFSYDGHLALRTVDKSEEGSKDFMGVSQLGPDIPS